MKSVFLWFAIKCHEKGKGTVEEKKIRSGNTQRKYLLQKEEKYTELRASLKLTQFILWVILSFNKEHNRYQ